MLLRGEYRGLIAHAADPVSRPRHDLDDPVGRPRHDVDDPVNRPGYDLDDPVSRLRQYLDVSAWRVDASSSHPSLHTTHS